MTMMIHDMEVREQGRAEGALGMLVNLVKQGLLSPENAAKQANMTVAEFEKQAALLPVSFNMARHKSPPSMS